MSALTVINAMAVAITMEFLRAASPVTQNQVVISAATALNATPPVIGTHPTRTQNSNSQALIPAWVAHNVTPTADTLDCRRRVYRAMPNRAVTSEATVTPAIPPTTGMHPIHTPVSH